MWRLLKSFSPELDFISDSDKNSIIVGGSFFMKVLTISVSFYNKFYDTKQITQQRHIFRASVRQSRDSSIKGDAIFGFNEFELIKLLREKGVPGHFLTEDVAMIREIIRYSDSEDGKLTSFNMTHFK